MFISRTNDLKLKSTFNYMFWKVFNVSGNDCIDICDYTGLSTLECLLRKKRINFRTNLKICGNRVMNHSHWPIYKDIYEHPDQHLVSRTPLWNDPEPCDLASQWRESWKTASAINSSLVTDPTVHPPGFDLPRRE